MKRINFRDIEAAYNRVLKPSAFSERQIEQHGLLSIARTALTTVGSLRTVLMDDQIDALVQGLPADEPIHIYLIDEPMRITDCPDQAANFDDLCQMIARGLHDIDLIDFASRLGLEESWDWDDVRARINDDFTAEDLDEVIHQGLS